MRFVACVPCQVIQYVGETLRYLLSQPYRVDETQHKVRLATGNGVRREVWIDFVKRFGIKQMGEYYGATESNSNLANSENKVTTATYQVIFFILTYPITPVIRRRAGFFPVFRVEVVESCGEA